MPRKPSLSRRSLLRGAAGAGAAGLAAGALGTTALTTAGAGALSTKDASPANTAANTPLVVHVRDARTGDIEVFAGTTQTRLRDRDLTARIAGAIR